MERLILCGGGHVSLALAQIGALLDFEVCVLDDRADFANAVRFPMAREVLALPFSEGLTRLGSRPSDFFCILTRGHTFDRACLEQILKGQYAYVGMIGSRGKVKAVMTALEGEGYPAADLQRVHAPIGLMLGGQTPAEVAVDIAAQLVQVRAGLGEGLIAPPEGPGVLVTITHKTGSAPRGEGAWMLVRPDGSAVGTIGGGAVEAAAARDALALWNGGAVPAEKEYDLGPNAADRGMVCGGRVTVKFEKRSV